jgi:hypothetical protein
MTNIPDDVYEMPPTLRDLPRSQEQLVLDAVNKHPKRRGELRSEYTRRILRIVREGK